MVVVLPFISCSSDDDSNGGQDPATAQWNLLAKKEVINGEEIDLKISNCLKQNKLQFYSDGMAVVTNYSDPGENDTVTCQYDGNYKGKWENRGNNIYAIIDEDGNERTGEFIFKGNVMEIHYSGDNSGTIFIYTMIEDY